MRSGGHRGRGQALLELAICLPVLISLALGASALARLADARSGLDAATAEAAAVAARAPDPSTAATEAQLRFAAVAAAYPLEGAALTLDLAGFGRGDRISATGSAGVDLAFALPPIPGRVGLTSVRSAQLQPWRSR